EHIKNALLLNQGAHFVVTCDETDYSKYIERGFEGLEDLPLKAFTPWKRDFSIAPIKDQARTISSPVAFTAKVVQGVSFTHPSSSHLSLAAHIMQNTTLHKKIREQGGAYGGGASYSPSVGNFQFYAYRDPNIAS